MNGQADFIDEETALHMWRSGGFDSDSFGIVLYSNFGRKTAPKERAKHHLANGHLFTSKHDEFGDTDCIHCINRVGGVVLPDTIGFDRSHLDGDYQPNVKGCTITAPQGYQSPSWPLMWHNVGAWICIDDPTDKFSLYHEGHVNKKGNYVADLGGQVEARRNKAIGSIEFTYSETYGSSSSSITYIFVKIRVDDEGTATWVCPPHPEWADLGYPQVGDRDISGVFSCYDRHCRIQMIPFYMYMHSPDEGINIEEYYTSDGFFGMRPDAEWMSVFTCSVRLFPRNLETPLTYTKGVESLRLLKQGELRDTIDLLDGPVTRGMPSAVKKKLTTICLKNLQEVSINSLAYLEDIRRLKTAIDPVIGLLRKPLNPKSWANLWLTYRYGLSLFISDTLEIAKAWQRETRKPWRKQFSTVRAKMPGVIISGHRTVVKQYHMKMYLRPQELEGFDKLYYFLRRTDLWPSFENIWDLIPFSFIVDWFIPIGKYLQDIDLSNDRRLIKVAKILISVKATLEDGTLIVADGFMGHVKWKHYHRWHEYHIPSWNSHTDHALGQGLDDSIHIIDSVSLAIQRRH